MFVLFYFKIIGSDYDKLRVGIIDNKFFYNI